MTNVELYPEKPLRGRRLTWQEFTQLTGRQRPDYQATAANDNDPKKWNRRKLGSSSTYHHSPNAIKCLEFE